MDCADAIEHPDKEELPEAEQFAKTNLVRLCRKIVNMIDDPDSI
jgi:hypothetical protein